MLYLVLAILSSCLISIVMRLSERHGKNRLSMLLFNYILCTALSASLAGFGSVPREGLGITLGMGTINGVLYLTCFMLLQWNIGRSGVVLASTFSKLGVIVPTLMAVLVFGEQPGIAQITGLALTIAAILLMNYTKQDAAKINGLWGLVLLMLLGGMADGMSKIFERTGYIQQSGIFLFVTFTVALILCAALAAARHERITRYDVLDGILLGIPNYFSTRFLLRSLSDVPAVIAYPSFSVGVIAAVAVIGVAVFRERFTKTQWIAMAAIAAALVLMNI